MKKSRKGSGVSKCALAPDPFQSACILSLSLPNDPMSLRDMRVLVVDDNATNRQILMRMLENWHMAPTAVESGAKAIVALREGKGMRTFPLILLDAQMPEMDGFALAEIIKRNPDWRTATVMMLHASAWPSAAAPRRRVYCGSRMPSDRQ